MSDYTVTNAGDANANQDYTASGTYNGKTLYVGDTTAAIEIYYAAFDGGGAPGYNKWVIGSSATEGPFPGHGGHLYESGQGGDTPYLGTYTATFGSSPDAVVSEAAGGDPSSLAAISSAQATSSALAASSALNTSSLLHASSLPHISSLLAESSRLKTSSLQHASSLLAISSLAHASSLAAAADPWMRNRPKRWGLSARRFPRNFRR